MKTIHLVSQLTVVAFSLWGCSDSIQTPNPPNLLFSSASIGFTSASQSVLEGTGALSETKLKTVLRLSSPHTGSVIAEVEVMNLEANDADHLCAKGNENGKLIQVEFQPGQTEAEVDCSIVADDRDEPNETFVLRVVSAGGLSVGPISSQTITILDDDQGIPEIAEPALWAQPVDVDSLQARPIAAMAEGKNEIETFVQGICTIYRFKRTLKGTVLNSYELNTCWSSVRKGMIRVRHVNSGSYPLSTAGLRYRRANGGVISPLLLANQSEIKEFKHSVESGVLKMEYREAYQNVETRKTYTLEMQGDAMRIRAYADPNHLSFHSNYNGFDAMNVESAPHLKSIFMPHGSHQRTFMFKVLGKTYFMTRYLDWIQSQSSFVTTLSQVNPLPEDYFFGSLTIENNQGQVLRPADETLYVAVSEDLDQTLVPPVFPRSPYYDVLSDSLWLVANSSIATGTNEHYKLFIQKISEWGLDKVFLESRHWEQYGWNAFDGDRQMASIRALDQDVLKEFGEEIQLFDPVFNSTVSVSAIDPYSQKTFEGKTLRDWANEDMGILSQMVKDKGYLWGLYTHLGLDPYDNKGGVNDYHAVKDDPLYVNIPAFFDGFGIYIPGEKNPLYDQYEHALVKKNDGSFNTFFDYNDTLIGTNYAGLGHQAYGISTNYLSDYTIDLFSQSALSYYPPEAVTHDALSSVSYRYDHTDNPDLPHSIGESIRSKFKEIIQFKDTLGVVSVGEGTYTHETDHAAIQAGLMDLWQGSYPSIESVKTVEGCPRSGPVIPDYKLKYVNPISHAGVSLFVGCYKAARNDSIFLQAEWAHSVVYGNIPYLLSAGHSLFSPVLMEDYIRTYYLFQPLLNYTKGSQVSQIEYWDGRSYRELQALLEEGTYDFTQSQIKVSYQNGSRVWVNLSCPETPISEGSNLTSPTCEGGKNWPIGEYIWGRNFTLPPHGFLATDEENFLVFSAFNPDSSGGKVDYSRSPNFEMISFRGEENGSNEDDRYDGFPSDEDVDLLGGEAVVGDTIVKHFRESFLLAARRGIWDFDQGGWEDAGDFVIRKDLPEPKAELSFLELRTQLDVSELRVGGKLGLRALASYGDQFEFSRDVTFLASFSVSDSDVASIDSKGVIRAKKAGDIAVTASYFEEGKTFSEEIAIRVVE